MSYDRFDKCLELLGNVIGDLDILAGYEMGPSGASWQDVAGTAAVNLHALANYLETLREGATHYQGVPLEGSYVFPSVRDLEVRYREAFENDDTVVIERKGLRGKDYCNCDHVRFLRAALEAAYINCPMGAVTTSSILAAALKADHQAMLDHHDLEYGTDVLQEKKVGAQ